MRKPKITLWNVHEWDRFVEQTFTVLPDGGLEIRNSEGRQTTYYSTFAGAELNGWRRTAKQALEEAIRGHQAEIEMRQGFVNSLVHHLTRVIADERADVARIQGRGTKRS